MYRPGKSVCRDGERKMVHPAFKSCLAHAHRGLTWLYHTQMTGLMHTHKGLAESCVGDVTMHACKDLSESYMDDVATHVHKGLAES